MGEKNKDNLKIGFIIELSSQCDSLMLLIDSMKENVEKNSFLFSSENELFFYKNSIEFLSSFSKFIADNIVLNLDKNEKYCEYLSKFD